MRWKLLPMLLLWLTVAGGCKHGNHYAGLQSALEQFVADKDAHIGIAVIIDGRDTVAVNAHEQFPMLSVYKFPIALAMAEVCRERNIPLDRMIEFGRDDLHADTYSPMTVHILSSSTVHTEELKMPMTSLLRYMLQQSDNNASDIVMREAGGADTVDSYLKKIGIDGIRVYCSEADMHSDNSLCYANSSTPMAMARLMDWFDNMHDDSISATIKHMMETCATGTGRLQAPIVDAGGVTGHKTGTGFELPDGRLMAVNDAGYVHLPDGRRYYIAVFIDNSGYDLEASEALIAEISRIVVEEMLRH